MRSTPSEVIVGCAVSLSSSRCSPLSSHCGHCIRWSMHSPCRSARTRPCIEIVDDDDDHEPHPAWLGLQVTVVRLGNARFPRNPGVADRTADLIGNGGRSTE